MGSMHPFSPGASVKKCKECGQILPMSAFHKDKHRKGGHYSVCRNCANGKRSARRKRRKAMMRNAMERFD